MKSEFYNSWLFLGLLSAGMALGAGSCSCNNNASMGPSYSSGPSGTPTLTPTPVIVISVGTSFSPTALTVSSGTVVTFNVASIHTVHIDNGAGSCSINYTSFPVGVPFSGASGTIYHIHCDVHSACGAGSCAVTCTGMVMTVAIQ
jgi:hypothetical protein